PNARGAAPALRRLAALSVPVLRAQPGVLPCREGDVGRHATRDEARAGDAAGPAQPSRRLVERVRVLTGRQCCRGQPEWYFDREARGAPRSLCNEPALQ